MDFSMAKEIGQLGPLVIRLVTCYVAMYLVLKGMNTQGKTIKKLEE